MIHTYLYAHGGSGNHGCEAIVRSTIKIFGKNDITLISSNQEEDCFYGLDHICSILKEAGFGINKKSLSFLRAYYSLKFKHDYIPMEKLRYKKSFDNIKRGDLALSIGGDNYCYADVKKYVMMHDMLKQRGAKTVLWGCSIESDIAKNPEISADLARYDLITARETITFETLRRINPNTILMPDPAFLLDKKETDLPKNFLSGNTVGINLSPMVIANEISPGITEKNYSVLIEYLLHDTDMNIALIPHVVWESSDDRVLLQKLYMTYKNTNRVCMIDDHRCDELKHIISKCRYFVGARTHATIASYSTYVPTIAIGYSVKARGIARDLFGTEEGYVLPVQSIKEKNDLLNTFYGIMSNEVHIKNQLVKKQSDVYDSYETALHNLRKLQTMDKIE